MSTKLPPTTSVDGSQFIQIQGADSVLLGFQYDQETKTFLRKDQATLFSGAHGPSHISTDPIPEATCDTPGLMGRDDKCKLDALLGTRLGVLGFMGSGQSDDSGWMQGDIILAAGTEFINLERFGNIVKISVDIPTPLLCNCETCTQIYWVIDPTSPRAITTPTCGGRLPNVNVYGELQSFLFPESTIVNPASPTTTLNAKGNYPALLFTRYLNGTTPNQAQYQLILKRNSNSLTTEVGMAFTPGTAGATVQHIIYMGLDNDGNLITYKHDPSLEPNLLGAILYKGHNITHKPAVVTGYTTTTPSTNQYTIREWNTDLSLAIGPTFTAVNSWQVNNPENLTTDPISPQNRELDSNTTLIPIGTLVDLYYYQIGEIAGTPIRRYYFSKQPTITQDTLWSPLGVIEYGNELNARSNLTPDFGSDDIDAQITITDYNNVDNNTIFGNTGFNTPIYQSSLTDGLILGRSHKATIDPTLPGLRINYESIADSSNFSELPTIIWNKIPHQNTLMKLVLGRPAQDMFPPYDIIFGPIDDYQQLIVRVVEVGTQYVDGINRNYIKVRGAHLHDFPVRGSLRTLNRDVTTSPFYNYSDRLIFPSLNPTTESDDIMLFATLSDNLPYSGSVGDLLELIHDDYDVNVIRVEFTINASSQIATQFQVGTLGMDIPYIPSTDTDLDDYVRGLRPGYSVSNIYVQDAPYSGIGTKPNTNDPNWVVYNGGFASPGVEIWNKLEVMIVEDQVFLWWNEIPIVPDTVLSGALPTPVDVSTQFYPIAKVSNYGKAGLRLFPGALIRSFEVRSQPRFFGQFTYGGVTLA